MISIQSHKVAYYSNYECMKTLVIHIQGTKFLASHSMMSKVFFLSQQPATFSFYEELSCPQWTEVEYAPLVLKWALHTQFVSAYRGHSPPASFEKENPGCHSTSRTRQWERSKNNTDKKPHFQFQCSLFMFIIIYVYLIISLYWLDIEMSNYSSRLHFQWHIYTPETLIPYPQT